MGVGEENPEDGEPTSSRRNRILSFLVISLWVLAVTWYFLPSGTIAAWECRHFGPCAAMDEVDYAAWKCMNTGPELKRAFCRSPKWVSDVEGGHTCQWWHEQVSKNCVTAKTDKCDYWRDQETKCESTSRR